MKMTNEQASNLLNVATALRDTIWTTFFTMHKFSWFDFEKATRLFRNQLKNSHPDVVKECGTPACAIGHYAARRDLQNTFSLNYASNSILSVASGRAVSLCGTKVQKEFGINFKEAQSLFGYSGCDNARTPVRAAQFIENFLSRKGWVPA